MPLISLEVLDREDMPFLKPRPNWNTNSDGACPPPPLSDSFRAVSSKRCLSAPWALNTIRDPRMKCRYLKPSSALCLSVMWLNKKNTGQHTQRPNDYMVAVYPGFVPNCSFIKQKCHSRMFAWNTRCARHLHLFIGFTVAASALTSQSCNIQICSSGDGKDMKFTDVDLRTRCTQRNQATHEQVCVKEKKKKRTGA